MTLASILVMTVTLFIMGALVFSGAMLDSSIAQIQENVDVNVYLELGAQEDDILALRRQIESLPEVVSVEYVSEEQALAEFRNRHQDDELITSALEELEENPLGAYFNIQATDTSQYESIAQYLESDSAIAAAGGTDIIDEVNFFENKEAIDRLTEFVQSVDTLSLVVMLVFTLIAVLIIFNTVRLAIYTSRDEISVMKLVGASNAYIRGPFVVEGVMYGVVSAIITLIIFYPAAVWVGPFTENFFGATNALDYYINNFAQMFVIMVMAGAVIGAVSSYLAVRKYLDV